MDNIPWWNISLGEDEVAAVSEALRNRCLSLGPVTAEFEQELGERLEVPHVVCTTSGTTALMLAYLATGIGPGDEVILPNRTWVATANAALLLGAKVKIVDTRPDCMLMDVDQLEGAITEKTKAIVPVPLNGVAVPIGRINEIADRYGITVIEDAAQALFSRSGNRYMGTSSRFGTFSLAVPKIITTGQGGFVVCHSDEDAEMLRRLRNMGMANYELNERHNILGGNFKFTDIQASIGLSQLKRLEQRLENQRDLYRIYRDGLQDIGCLRLIKIDVDAGEIPQRCEVTVTDRDGFMAALAEYGVGTSVQAPNISEFPFVGADPADYPNSRIYGTNNVVLPSGPDQPPENARRAVEVIRMVADRFESWPDR